MERVKNLSVYQKILLIFAAVMIIVFTVLYIVTTSRVGYAYMDAILVRTRENGNTLYSGKVRGGEAVFTVYDGENISFEYDGTSYGTYTIREDASAVPEESDAVRELTGIEIRNGGEITFRGGVETYADAYLFYNEDGSFVGMSVFAESYGEIYDEDGNRIDPMEPSVYNIYELTHEPDLTASKGHWGMFALGVVVCLALALSILFADEIFRFNLRFSITDPEKAEPSGWEIAGRYIGWTVAVIVALVVFIMGLR